MKQGSKNTPDIRLKSVRMTSEDIKIMKANKKVKLHFEHFIDELNPAFTCYEE